MKSWPDGYGLRRFEELDSTNDEARRLALTGEAGPLWLTAARQTMGRGRRGRVWDAGSGNLVATLLIRPPRPQAQWAQLSFVAAIAVSDMAAHYAPVAAIALKWPNDVLAEGRKLAGILLETAGASLAIGIGINLRTFPEDSEFPAVSLTRLGVAAPEPQVALTRLARDFAQWYEVWDGQGFSPVRDAWLARAAGMGGRIRARLPDRDVTGVFEGLDADGALLLNDGHATRAIAAGDVFFG